MGADCFFEVEFDVEESSMDGCFHCLIWKAHPRLCLSCHVPFLPAPSHFPNQLGMSLPRGVQTTPGREPFIKAWPTKMYNSTATGLLSDTRCSEQLNRHELMIQELLSNLQLEFLIKLQSQSQPLAPSALQTTFASLPTSPAAAYSELSTQFAVHNKPVPFVCKFSLLRYPSMSQDANTSLP